MKIAIQDAEMKTFQTGLPGSAWSMKADSVTENDLPPGTSLRTRKGAAAYTVRTASRRIRPDVFSNGNRAGGAPPVRQT